MTEKQFNEIVARAGQPPLGTSSQVKTDVSDLISEITRRAADVPFEQEPSEDVFSTPLGRQILEDDVRRTSGARKK